MQYQPIQSEANARFKRWKKLADSGRAVKKEGATLAEGVHLAQTALERSVPINAVILRSKGINAEAESLLTGLQRSCAPFFVLDSTLYDAISPVEHGAGLMLEVRLPVLNRPQSLDEDVLYLDGVQDPGNIGTLIRTAVASGVTNIVASAGCANCWSAKALRAGMGAHFAAAIYENVSPEEVVGFCRGRRLAADARGGSDLYATAGWEKGPTVWMMGSEGQGLSDAALSVAEQRLYIPIQADCESLNVSAAAAVCLFEQRRRRRER